MDEIRQKLAAKDRQLAGGAILHRQAVAASPLLFAATGLIAGIILQRRLAVPIAVWLIFLVICTTATIIFFAIRRNGTLYVTVYLSLICFLCLGAIRLTSFMRPHPDDIRNLIGSERRPATIRGLIVTDPYINKNEQWQFAKFRHTDPPCSFYLKLNEIKTVGGWAKIHGTVRAQVSEPVLNFRAGDYVQAYCWLDRLKPATNPGQFDLADYLGQRNIFIAASIETADAIELLENSRAGIFTRAKTRFTKQVTEALLGNTEAENPGQALIQALLLGYRGSIDQKTYQAFRKTGLLHLLSLSGLHLGIFVGIIWWLCKTIGLIKYARAFICIIALGIFLLIVPPRAPTIRAAIIAFVFFMSFFFRRRSNPVNTLSLAAIILLLIRPTQLFEPGWQLSFASVLGIILFAGRIYTFISEKTGDVPFFVRILKNNLLPNMAVKFGSYLLRLLTVGLAAWLGGAGILLYHFYSIDLLTPLWTVIALPLVALVMALGYLKIILTFLLPSAALVLGKAVTNLAYFLIWLVKFLARLDISHILIGRVSLTPAILYYSLILFAAFVYFRRPLLKKAVFAIMALAIIVFLGVTKWQRTYRDNLILNCLDVGHGQAILAQLPGRANVLFDAGSMYKNNIGSKIVTPFMDYAGIEKIDAIIISHNDIDHINGIPEVAEYCTAGGVYANDDFFDNPDPWATAKFLSDYLSQMGVRIKRMDQLPDFRSAAKIQILWPNKHVHYDNQLGDNDKSLVSLIEFAGKKILLCSDIEQFAQRELLRLYPDLKADIVVVPHHGSANTLEPGFLESLDADILIYSCDQSQYERATPVTGLVGSSTDKAKSFYTVRDGVITVRINKNGIIKNDISADKILCNIFRVTTKSYK